MKPWEILGPKCAVQSVRALRNELKLVVQIDIVEKRGGSFFNLREKIRTITDSWTSRMKVFPLCLLSQWQVIILAYISGTDFRAGYCARVHDGCTKSPSVDAGDSKTWLNDAPSENQGEKSSGKISALSHTFIHAAISYYFTQNWMS